MASAISPASMMRRLAKPVATMVPRLRSRSTGGASPTDGDWCFRQRKREPRALSGAALHGDGPAVSLHGELAEGQPQAGRHLASSLTRRDLTELGEDLLVILHWDPLSVVFH